MTEAAHVMIATPMYGGVAHARYIESIISFGNLAKDNKVSVTYSFMGNESLITRARNALVHEFMKTPCTHLFFIDADIGFRPHHALKMVMADKDIIAGVYPKKDINWPAVSDAVKRGVPANELYRWTADFVINVENMPSEGIQIPTNEPFPVRNAGTGLMLIKRRVFDDLKDKIPYYVNNMTMQNQSLKIESNKIYEYFATSIDPDYNVLLSEDYHFCQLWKKAGGDVFIAPWADLTHSGTYEFTGNFHRTPI